MWMLDLTSGDFIVKISVEEPESMNKGTNERIFGHKVILCC